MRHLARLAEQADDQTAAFWLAAVALVEDAREKARAAVNSQEGRQAQQAPERGDLAAALPLLQHTARAGVPEHGIVVGKSLSISRTSIKRSSGFDGWPSEGSLRRRPGSASCW